jgi:hypothetical protein
MVRDAQGNVQKDFGLPKGFPVDDVGRIPDPIPTPPPKVFIDDGKLPGIEEDKAVFEPALPIDVLEKQDPIDVQDPTGDPLLDTVVYEPIDDVGTISDKLTFLEGIGRPPMIAAPAEPISINMGPGSGGAPWTGQQPQPTGLQGLGQFMQNPNPQSFGMGQNLQQFSMQSPVPFGTQQSFSSGFGGFGQPMMGQTLRGTGF